MIFHCHRYNECHINNSIFQRRDYHEKITEKFRGIQSYHEQQNCFYLGFDRGQFNQKKATGTVIVFKEAK
jgi:hypothetical protein